MPTLRDKWKMKKNKNTTPKSYKSYTLDSNSSKSKMKMQTYSMVFENTILIKKYN